MFDCHVKRIHEYKRQLLNALRIIVVYDRLRATPTWRRSTRPSSSPVRRRRRTGGEVDHQIHQQCGGDDQFRSTVAGQLKVFFFPEYDVSLAEGLIAAADVSNQISTAGYEASGTSNMKFMMNGALTLGTRDGATIEMAEAAGEDNLFLFGLTSTQVAGTQLG